MDTSHWMNINELPHVGGISKLYVDYICDFKKVQKFYESDYRSFPHLQEYTEHLNGRLQHRPVLVEVLTEQNKTYGASEQTLDNIRRLLNDNTFAVVTGQQVGILSGPLYTIYKIITAIQLANQLNAKHSEYRFVPIFWLEGEDHDFEEVNKVGVLSPDHKPTTIAYLLNGKPLAKNIGAVGEIVFDGYVTNFFENLQRTMGNSEFKKPLIDLLQTFYRPNVTFNHAFASLLNSFFGDAGLVIISSNDRRLKQLLSPIFQKEIQEYPRVSQLIIQQSAELEEDYHAQIKTKALNLFHFFKGGRYFVEPREHDFSLKGTRHFIPKDEMLQIAAENPELLSPNVALRPICQDMILPTVAYVAGPSEVAYFAQLKEVYRYFGLRMPVIYPRATATIVEEKFEKIMEKYQLDVNEFFGNPERINRKVVELVSEIKIDDIFESSTRRLSDLLNELKFGLNYIDPTLLGALETTKSKMEYQLTSLKEKTSAAQQRRHEIALRQVRRVANSIFPNQNFQERELSTVYFMNKHGLDFVKWLRNEVTIGEFKHQLIRI